jgi:hypothetical protein
LVLICTRAWHTEWMNAGEPSYLITRYDARFGARYAEGGHGFGCTCMQVGEVRVRGSCTYMRIRRCWWSDDFTFAPLLNLEIHSRYEIFPCYRCNCCGGFGGTGRREDNSPIWVSDYEAHCERCTTYLESKLENFILMTDGFLDPSQSRYHA